MSSGRLQVDAALEIELLPLALEFFAECLLPGIEELCLLVRSNGLVPVFALRFVLHLMPHRLGRNATARLLHVAERVLPDK